jgi:ribosomal protein S18 acetylase RimI-like enzyme
MLEGEALAVWYAARVAEGKTPDEQRVGRVRDKLADVDAHLGVVERAGQVAGMALAEAFREQDGSGPEVPGWGHVSMVFVHPEHQRRGVGSELMRRLIVEVPWPGLSLWTREANVPAQRLYSAVGFTPTGEVGRTPHGDPIRRWQRVDARPSPADEFP